MGLDIYLYKLKSQKAFDKYFQMRLKYDELWEAFENKYNDELTHHDEVFSFWYSRMQDINQDDAPELYKKSMAKMPKMTFATKEELKELHHYESYRKYRLKALGVKHESDTNSLIYMRKRNWMVRYVESRHPECLHNYGDYGKVIQLGACILNRDDIQELVNRMETILKDWVSYEEQFNKDGWTRDPQNRDMWYKTQDFEEYCRTWKGSYKLLKNARELLPTLSRFFFGSTEYNYEYFEGLSKYLEEFRKLLITMKPKDKILYEESW